MDQKKIKSGTLRTTSTMQPMQAESSSNNIQKSPEWEKVEKPAPAPLGPQDGWGDSQATYGPFVPTSPGYSGADQQELDDRQKEGKKNIDHAGMSWTPCYDDRCFVHLSEKQGRWFPMVPDGTEKTHYQEKPTLRQTTITSSVSSASSTAEAKTWQHTRNARQEGILG